MGTKNIATKLIFVGVPHEYVFVPKSDKDNYEILLCALFLLDVGAPGSP